MIETASLFDAPTARNTDPDTSHLAAERVANGAASLRCRAHEALIAAGKKGMTDFELATALDSFQTSIGVRRGELVKAGLVEYAGIKRPSPHGSPSMVWRGMTWDPDHPSLDGDPETARKVYAAIRAREGRPEPVADLTPFLRPVLPVVTADTEWASIKTGRTLLDVEDERAEPVKGVVWEIVGCILVAVLVGGFTWYLIERAW